VIERVEAGDHFVGLLELDLSRAQIAKQE